MESKSLTRAVLLIFCFGLFITNVGIVTGAMARNRKNVEEPVKKEEKAVSDTDIKKKNQNIENQNAESQNAENQNIENQNAENQNIENQNAENQNIENQNIENQNAESQNTENQNAEKESEKILSRFETTGMSEEARNQNLKTACDRLNGTQWQPGEIISFNDVAGPYTEESGYASGTVIISEGFLGEEVGGGVCQVSTTLYNAALRGNLGIVERHRHSFPMDYVEVGLDAMIYAPDNDLKIQNTTNSVLYIEAFANEGTVVIQLKGAALDTGSEIQVEAYVLNTLVPEGEEIRLSTDLEEGVRQVYREQRNGYVTRVYRKVYHDGVLVSEEILSEDTYPSLRRIVIEGCQQSK